MKPIINFDLKVNLVNNMSFSWEFVRSLWEIWMIIQWFFWVTVSTIYLNYLRLAKSDYVNHV